MSREESREYPVECIIRQIVVPTTPSIILDGDFVGYTTTLRGHPNNGVGLIYIYKEGGDVTENFPLGSDDSKDTECDIDKLRCYSDNGTEILCIWAEKRRII